jgi:hypothetical protein
MTTTICALCHNPRPLLDSHFLPAAVYKNLLDPTGPIKNMIVSNGTTASERSDQVSQPLLCQECEILFQQGGESWVLARRLMPDGSFVLRDILRASPPARTTPKGELVYEAASIPGVNPEQLVYFAASIFWRGAVADWDLPTGKYPKLGISPELIEALRKYLLGEQPLPPDVVILLHISAAAQPTQTAFPPYPVSGDGVGFHFYIPGMLFTLIRGGQAALLEASLARHPNRLAISATGDEFMLRVGRRHGASSELSERLKKKLP